MNSFLDKFSFGRDKGQADAKRLKQEEEQLEAELQDFIQHAPNSKSLQAALRATAASPASYLSAEASTDRPSSGNPTELEQRILECFHALQAARRARVRTPVKLVRLVLSRFEEHLCEPSTRLPVAAEAIYTILSMSPNGMDQFLEVGIGKVICKIFEVMMEELELRTQLAPDCESKHPHYPAPSSSSASPPRVEEGVQPLYRLAHHGLLCVSLFLANSPEVADAQQEGTQGSSSFSLPWKSKKKTEKKNNGGGGSSPTAASPQSPALTEVFTSMIKQQPQLVPLVLRVFGLQCRCALPSSGVQEKECLRSIFSLSCKVLSVLVAMDVMYVHNVFEGAGILFLRANDAAMGSPGDSQDHVECRSLLAQAGSLLALVSRSIQRWPIESSEHISNTLFLNHFSCTLRSTVLFHPFDDSVLLEEGGAGSVDSNDAAREALEHFFSDTYAGRHWRDVADALQLDTSRLVVPPVPRVDVGSAAEAARGLSAWVDGLNAFFTSIRWARDRLVEAAYRRKGTDRVADGALDVFGQLESSLVESFRTVPASSVTQRKGPASKVSSSTTPNPQSCMHRWFITYVASLFPLHPQQVRPPERSRVAMLHRLVKFCGLLEYFFTDPSSGWSSPLVAQTERLGLVAICVRYLLLVEDPTSVPLASAAAVGASPATKGQPLRSPTTSQSGGFPMGMLRVVLETLEQYAHSLVTLPRPTIVAAIVPLCALLRWGMVCKEQGTTDLLTEACATATLCSSASALARNCALPNDQLDSKVCCGLETVVDTLNFLLSFRVIMQFQLRHEPAALLQLMVHESVRQRAGKLVQKLLCYEPEHDETDQAYQLRMSNIVMDLWDITTNSREVPDDVYLAILDCVRSSLDKAYATSPFLQTKLQNAICSSSFAADCYLRLVHPLNAGWHTLDSQAGRAAVLATMSSLIRANPVQRHRLATTVGESQLVKAATMSCENGRVELGVVDELLAVVFEDLWRRPSPTTQETAKTLCLAPCNASVTVQNANILEALLVHLGEVLRNCDEPPVTIACGVEPTVESLSGDQQPDAVASPNEIGTAESGLVRGEAVRCLMRVVDRLRASFARCRASVWACATRHVFEHLVHLLPFLQEQHHISAMENCLSLLTARHISIRQLKRLLGVISHAPTINNRRLLLPCVIEILHAACHTHIHCRGEPKNYIALRSRSGPAGLSMAFAQFPKHGYTLSLWLRWEGHVKSEECDVVNGCDALATLMSLSSEPCGGDTTFRVDIARDGSLVLCLSPSTRQAGISLFGGTSGSESERSSIHILEGFQVQPQQWFHVVLTHKTAMFGQGEIVAFINGRELRPVKAAYPTIHPSGALSMIIGSTAETIQGRVWTTPLHGQLNAIYVFNKVLVAKEVGELYSLGANHATCFLPSEKALVSKANGLYESSIGEKVLVCIDPRLSEKGVLFNAANVTKIAASRSALAMGAALSSVASSLVQVTLHEGAFTCHTSSIIDTTCSLGALQSLILPLLVMQVNAQLPISPKGLMIDERSILSEASTALRDTLKLLESLIIVDVVRVESLSLGTFSILAHVLERLGFRVGPEIPQRLGKLCGSISDFQDVFNGSFQALFMSVPLFQSCGYETRRAFIDSMRSMCKVEDVRRSMRALGLMPHLVHVIIQCCRSCTPDDKSLRDIIFSLMDFMMVSPIRKDDAEAILALVANVRATEDSSVAEHMMEQTRFLLLSRPTSLRNLLGHMRFAAVLLPLLKYDDSDVIRCEAARMLCSVVHYSKAAQATFHRSHDGNVTKSRAAAAGATADGHTTAAGHENDTDDITLATVADSMRAFPFTPYTYLSLRCAATESNQFLSTVQQLPLPELGNKETLVFAPVLVPLLMLVRDSPRELRVEVLTDIFVLISSDMAAWQSILNLDGWYILICDVMLADDIGVEYELFGKYRSGASKPQTPEEQSVEELLDIGIHIMSSILGLAVCSPHHDCEDIDQIISYIHQIRQDGRVRLIAHALQYQVLENCALRSGSPMNFATSELGASLRDSLRAPAGETSTRASKVIQRRGAQQPYCGKVGAEDSSSAWTTTSSPMRQRTIYTNPIIERNIQQFFYSVEDQLFYTYDVSTALSAQRGDFVCVDAADGEELYTETKSRVFMSPLRAAKTSSELLRRSCNGTLDSEERQGDDQAAVVDAELSRSATDITSLVVDKAEEWLHADLALMSLQFLSSCVVLVNNSTLPANAATTSESRARRGGVQRIYLRILKASLSILYQDNDFVEAVVATLKNFQSFLDKAVSKFFTSRRSVVDVQDDPPLRSALSIIVILYECILSRKLNGRSGGRNRYVNQALLVRLKAGMVDNMPVLRELGAFHKPSPAHLDSHHRVALKTQDWIESPDCTDVDEFLEIAQREDFKHLIVLITDVVRPLEDHAATMIRDLAVRYHSNSSTRAQQTLKHMVLLRQSMMERVESFIVSESTVSMVTAALESVLGDANASKVSLSVIATNWGKFVSRLKGTIWDVDPAEKGTKFVKLCRVEQRPLVQYKMVKDKDGTDHQSITKKDDNGDADDDENMSLFSSRAKRSISVRLRRDQAAGLEELEDTDDADLETPAAAPNAQMTEFEEAAASSLTSIGDALFEKALKVPCELSHLMHCWSCTLVISDEGTLTVLIDEENKAYNQIVAKDAQPFLHRPRGASSWHVHDIVQIAPGRRFRMRRAALEIFFRDRSSILLNFPSISIMRQSFQVLRRLVFTSRADIPREVTFWNENPRKELARQRITEAWKHREMTNMDYLLALNLLAGRTLNDLTQYPIFPWVVADYDSESLDLTSPETFRDLSQPVGLCGGPGRREDIEMRYEEMSSMGDVPFHYFTHYSSPAVVLYFLVRVEPFTTCHIVLQGGRFDVPDRMFHSVVASWAGVTKNIQDVKEMIPECYYLPEMYINNNNVRFGLKQDKKLMKDAILPKWSANDPYTHVYKMREALECDYVSSQLHHWIDLIFGYKQRGRNAVDALNLFHPHTYEVEHHRGGAGENSAEDLTQSAEERNIVIDSLDNIGQTPIQLFVKKHPERKANLAVNPIVDTYAFGFKVIAPQPGHALDRVAVVRITRSDRLVVVAASGAVLVYRFNRTPVLAKKESTPSRYRLEGVIKKIEDLRAATHSFDTDASPEQRISALPIGCMPSVSEAMEWEQSKVMPATGAAIRNSSTTPTPSSSFGLARDSTTARHEPCSWRNTAVVCLGSESALFVIHAGFFDNTCVIRALNVPCEELRFSSHRDRIVCLAASDDSRFLVTGGRDTTFIVWSLTYRSRVFVNLLFSICGHEEEPSALALSNQLDLVVTASRDGQWMMHSLSSGKLEQCLVHPDGFSVDFVLIQSRCYVPNVLVSSHVDFKVHQYTVNGSLLRSIALPGRLLQWCGSGDPANAMLLMTPQNILSTDPATIVFYHSFYLTQTSKVVPTTAPDVEQALAASLTSSTSSRPASSFGSVPGNNGSDVWMTCVDAHQSNPQLMVTGTANGSIILLRTEAVR